MPPTPHTPVLIAAAAVADVVCVLAFVLAGRRSHDEGAAIVGIARTAWPFLAGLLAGWALTRAWRRPLAAVRTGLPVVAITVAAGMVLRVVVGQGTAFAFVLVACAVLGALLVGWRALVPVVRSVRRSPRTMEDLP